MEEYMIQTVTIDQDRLEIIDQEVERLHKRTRKTFFRKKVTMDHSKKTHLKTTGKKAPLVKINNKTGLQRTADKRKITTVETELQFSKRKLKVKRKSLTC
jgi:hypothetical protein